MNNNDEQVEEQKPFITKLLPWIPLMRVLGLVLYVDTFNPHLFM